METDEELRQDTDDGAYLGTWDPCGILMAEWGW